MSNFFKEVKANAGEVEKILLGPSYSYWENIKTPQELGMSSKGTIPTIAKDINGLINYVEVLVSGKSKASKTGKPLGNKFFLKTGATCKDKETNEIVDRYMYINNVPNGSIPFISSGMNMDFKEFKGLVPGTMSNLADINPMVLFQSFMTGENPECQEITLETIDAKNNKGKETRHVTTMDLKNINPCDFKPFYDKNPITDINCIEAFGNLSSQTPDDLLVKLFYASLGLGGIYLLIKLMKKMKEN